MRRDTRNRVLHAGTRSTRPERHPVLRALDALERWPSVARLALAAATVVALLVADHRSPALTLCGSLVAVVTLVAWCGRPGETVAVVAMAAAALVAGPAPDASASGLLATWLPAGLVAFVGWVVVTVRRSVRDGEERARADELTGVLTRRAFTETYERERARSLRRGTPLALAVLDLDGLKAVNDASGHLAGDLLLQEAARAVQAGVRPYDRVGRFGGDEFALLLPDADARATRRIVERVMATMAATSGARASVGVVTWSRPPSLDRAVAEADELMYRVKRAGGGGMTAVDRTETAPDPDHTDIDLRGIDHPGVRHADRISPAVGPERPR